MSTTTSKTVRAALSAGTVPAVLFALFEDVSPMATVTPNRVREIVEPTDFDPTFGTVVFWTAEGVVECPTEFWASGALGRLAHTVGWEEHVTRKPIVLPEGVTVDFFGHRPVTGWSKAATVLNSLRTDV